MTSANRRFTVAELLDYLDDNFDILDDGLNSDIEGLNEENNLLPVEQEGAEKEDVAAKVSFV